MPLDDDRDETAAFGVPLPPEDRLWRHPSELSANPAAPAPPPGNGPSRRSRPGVSLGVALLTGLAGAAFALAVVAVTGHLDAPSTTEAVTDAARATPVSLAAASVAESVMPTVAHLAVSRQGGEASASAVVYRSDGYLLTTAQAVARTTQITAVLADGRMLPATVVGADPATEVAVVHVDATDLQSAPLGRSAELRVGDPALTVGAPAASGSGTLTDGVVSATGRTLSLPSGSLHDLIATDRQVPSDSDGGAMVDAAGQVTGLCISVPAGAATTPVGFAVPIDVATSVADQLIATGRVEHGWLGVTGTDLASDTARHLGVQGVQIRTVQWESPAEEAGLRSGDIIVAADRKPITSMSQLVSLTLSRGPGTRVSIDYLRGADHRATVVILGRAQH